MTNALRGKLEMLSNLAPSLEKDEYVFCSVAPPARGDVHTMNPIATFHEKEGWTFILERQRAQEAGLNVSPAMRLITLNVNSALDGVGLTAGVAAALADANIPCNMVAGFHHDHVFVPTGSADHALSLLVSLQMESARAFSKS
jgi:hypothetical protein